MSIAALPYLIYAVKAFVPSADSSPSSTEAALADRIDSLVNIVSEALNPFLPEHALVLLLASQWKVQPISMNHS